MLASVRALWDGLVSSALPPACAACGALGREPFCALCAEALEDAPRFSVEGVDDARAAWLYGGPAAIAVQRLKYDGHPELARPLGLALRPLVDLLEPVDLVVPVPLSPRRLVERGYNQSRELARPLGRPVRPRAILRSDGAREQVGLSKAARLSNLATAFHPGPERVEGRRVLLLDDVVTTGATAAAAARALRSAGAAWVAVLAVARAG